MSAIPKIDTLFVHLNDPGTAHAELSCIIPVEQGDLFIPDEPNAFVACPEGFAFGDWVLVKARDLREGFSTLCGVRAIPGPALLLRMCKAKARKPPEEKALLGWFQGALPNIHRLIRLAHESEKAEISQKEAEYDARVIETEVQRLLSDLTADCRSQATADPAYQEKLAELHRERDLNTLALVRGRIETERAGVYTGLEIYPALLETWRKLIHNKYNFRSDTEIAPDRADKMTAQIFDRVFRAMSAMTLETLPRASRPSF